MMASVCLKLTSNKSVLLLLSVLFILLAGCASPHSGYDYSALMESKPRSILVIPPLNNSIEVEASYTYLSTVSRPLAEKGYYVFPVAVIDNLLKENGLPTPAEMNSIPLDKIREVIGADAVLYVTIDNWGQKYQLINSRTVVSATIKLVDARTGTLLWDAKAYGQENSDNGNNGLLGAIVSAAITQVLASATDKTPGIARQANNNAINNSRYGLLDGPYKPEINKK